MSWSRRITRTLSRPIDFVMPRRTASSASKRTVQRLLPSGGSLHTSATMRCCCAAVILTGEPLRAPSPIAPSMPPSRKRLRMRPIVARDAPDASVIASFFQLLSDSSRTRARLCSRGESSPSRSNPSSRLRCDARSRIVCSTVFILTIDHRRIGMSTPI
jgi:hypothetical protein